MSRRFGETPSLATLIACGGDTPTLTATVATTGNANQTVTWTSSNTTVGTSSDDYALGIATDANGNVYATGDTDGDLDGSNAGDRDAFIRSYGR